MTKEKFFDYLETIIPEEYSGIFNTAHYRPKVLHIKPSLVDEAKKYLSVMDFDDRHSSFEYKGIPVVVSYSKKWYTSNTLFTYYNSMDEEQKVDGEQPVEPDVAPAVEAEVAA